VTDDAEMTLSGSAFQIPAADAGNARLFDRLKYGTLLVAEDRSVYRPATLLIIIIREAEHLLYRRDVKKMRATR